MAHFGAYGCVIEYIIFDEDIVATQSTGKKNKAFVKDAKRYWDFCNGEGEVYRRGGQVCRARAQRGEVFLVDGSGHVGVEIMDPERFAQATEKTRLCQDVQGVIEVGPILEDIFELDK